MSEVTLFVRKASGLVRSWSMFDAFVYATFSINLITLGLYIFSFAYWFQGNLITAIVVGGILTVFEVIVYASLISAMPRAGGDYVWQSRILGRGIGFVLAVTGWWFILWLWVPLYAQMLSFEVFTPLFAILGAPNLSLAASTSNGILVSAIILCALVTVYIAVGMKWYARIQKFCFYGGVIGLAIVLMLLLFGNQLTFVTNLNTIVPEMYGTAPVNYYTETLVAGEAAGANPNSLSSVAFIASFALIPLIVFFNLWPNWGSTLYGEVRGANDFKRNFWGMTWAIIVTASLAVIFLLLISKTLGWGFYQAANGAFWNPVYYPDTSPPAPLPFWPYPAFLASFLVNSRAIQFIVIALMSLWWFGWSGTVFLSSTRVIFAAAFDRMLPEGVSYIEPRTRTPIIALMLMVIPALIISVLYAYNFFSFTTLVLDSTLVISVTFWGTTLAAIILPWRSKEVYDSSPIAKYKMPSWLGYLMTLIFVVGGIYLIYTSFSYGWTVLTNLVGLDSLTVAMALVVALLTVVNAGVIIWLVYYISKRILAGEKMPLVTLAGIVFFLFLDWLLVEWFWDPHVPPFDFAYYAIGWKNATSMLFMIFNYAAAAVIYLFFSNYRKRHGIDVNKVYKAIPVE